MLHGCIFRRHLPFSEIHSYIYDQFCRTTWIMFTLLLVFSYIGAYMKLVNSNLHVTMHGACDSDPPGAPCLSLWHCNKLGGLHIIYHFSTWFIFLFEVCFLCFFFALIIIHLLRRGPLVEHIHIPKTKQTMTNIIMIKSMDKTRQGTYKRKNTKPNSKREYDICTWRVKRHTNYLILVASSLNVQY